MIDKTSIPILAMDMGVTPTMIVIDPPYDFAAEHVRIMSRSLTVPMEMLGTPVPRSVITPKMSRLLRSADRRKRKRGRRLYFKLNGKGASRFHLQHEISQGIWDRARKVWTDHLLQMSAEFIQAADAMRSFGATIAASRTGKTAAIEEKMRQMRSEGYIPLEWKGPGR